MIMYLHGFRSSPLSFKAQSTALFMEKKGLSEYYFCPQLPESPKEAIRTALDLMNRFEHERITLIGSSLGGYYANWLAEKTGCRAVLLNPVIDPWNIRPTREKPIENLELEEWEKDLVIYGTDLRELKISENTRPERYFLIAATGDEMLDYRLMAEHYRLSRQIIIQGSDHSLPEYVDYLDEILAFSAIRN